MRIAELYAVMMLIVVIGWILRAIFKGSDSPTRSDAYNDITGSGPSEIPLTAHSKKKDKK